MFVLFVFNSIKRCFRHHPQHQQKRMNQQDKASRGVKYVNNENHSPQQQLPQQQHNGHLLTSTELVVGGKEKTGGEEELKCKKLKECSLTHSSALHGNSNNKIRLKYDPILNTHAADNINSNIVDPSSVAFPSAAAAPLLLLDDDRKEHHVLSCGDDFEEITLPLSQISIVEGGDVFYDEEQKRLRTMTTPVFATGLTDNSNCNNNNSSSSSSSPAFIVLSSSSLSLSSPPHTPERSDSCWNKGSHYSFDDYDHHEDWGVSQGAEFGVLSELGKMCALQQHNSK
jgi:hypothetical protein